MWMQGRMLLWWLSKIALMRHYANSTVSYIYGPQNSLAHWWAGQGDGLTWTSVAIASIFILLDFNYTYAILGVVSKSSKCVFFREGGGESPNL